jgi:superoxide reductase
MGVCECKSKLCEYVKTEDFKKEKHVPVIDFPHDIQAGEPFTVTVEVGKEIPHPNTTEHHIQWIELHYKPDGDQYSYLLGRTSFDSHGASVEGPNTGPAHTSPHACFKVSIMGPGTFTALEQCNIHGIWEYSTPVKV